MPLFSFQLSELKCLETRSRGPNDVDLITFGVLVNKREHGRFTAVSPVFKNYSLRGKEIAEAARSSGLPYEPKSIKKDWEIGPVEVNPGDSVEIVTTITNTGDANLPTADQQKMDELVIKSLNIYYSWLLGQFVSGLGLTAVQEFVGAGAGAVASFFADPVGKILGYQKSGPCNGTVVAQVLQYSHNELQDLPYHSMLAKRQLEVPGLTLDLATVTNLYTASENHNSEGCGAPARTEVEVSIRRYPFWSWRYFEWDWGNYNSMKRKFPEGGSLKQLVQMRM
jgi:hypothetical protein